MMTGIDHVSFSVSDLSRSVEFYKLLLRTEPLSARRDTTEVAARVIGYPEVDVRFAYFASPATTAILELFEYLKPAARAISLENYHVGNGHLGLVVDDLEAEWRRLAAAGTRFASPEPVAVDTGLWKGSKAIYMRGSDGITTELLESPPSAEVRFPR